MFCVALLMDLFVLSVVCLALFGETIRNSITSTFLNLIQDNNSVLDYCILFYVICDVYSRFSCCCMPSETYGRNGVTPIFRSFHRTASSTTGGRSRWNILLCFCISF